MMALKIEDSTTTHIGLKEKCKRISKLIEVFNKENSRISMR